MSLRGLNWLLLLALLASLALHAAIGRRDATQSHADFLPCMAELIAYGAFDPHPHFPDGKTLRESTSGTIARGRLPLHCRATPEDALRAGEELHNPFTLGDSERRQHGEFVVTNYCQIYHALCFSAQPCSVSCRVTSLASSLRRWFNAEMPFTPAGCIAQAWSVAEALLGNDRGNLSVVWSG